MVTPGPGPIAWYLPPDTSSLGAQPESPGESDTQSGGKAKPHSVVIRLSPAARALPTGIFTAEQHTPGQTSPELLLLILQIYQDLNILENHKQFILLAPY